MKSKWQRLCEYRLSREQLRVKKQARQRSGSATTTLLILYMTVFSKFDGLIIASLTTNNNNNTLQSKNKRFTLDARLRDNLSDIFLNSTHIEQFSYE